MVTKLYSPDYGKDIGSLGIKLPMNKMNTDVNTVFNLSYYTEEQAVSNMVNLLLTASGERFMQPRFGVGLMRYLFEQDTDTLESILLSSINEQVQIWLPYIDIDTIKIIRNDDNQIGIVINFEVSQIGANKQITIFNVSGKPQVEINESN